MKQIKILITGGHLTVAIALIEHIQKEYPDWQIVFVGRTKSLEGYAALSEEARIVRQMGVRFLPIIAARTTRVLTFSSITSVLKFPAGFVIALWYILREKPSCVLFFGGYVGLPVVVLARMFGIPVVVHEQTMVLGLGARIAVRLGARLCVSFVHTQGLPKGTRAVVTGLPLRRGVCSKPGKQPACMKDAKEPILYITGGSSGSTSLNEIVFEILPGLLKKFTIVHQTGPISLPKAKRMLFSLPPDLAARYVPVRYIDMPDYAWVIHHAHIVVGRSGANSVAEFAKLGKVAILVPLPWSAEGEQLKNALYLAQNGAAVVIEQKYLTGHSFVGAIDAVVSDYATFLSKAKRFAESIPDTAAQKILDVVVSSLHISVR